MKSSLYSLAARLQDNSRPKSPTKVETKRKLQQFTVYGWLIMKEGESGNEQKRENFKVEITFNNTITCLCLHELLFS